MGILKSIFGRKEKPIKSYLDFWEWFKDNEQAFFKTIKKGEDIQVNFFDKLAPKLEQLRDGYFYLAGMINDDTAELVITADGNLKNIVFVEELVEAAPAIDGWKITAHKPAVDYDGYQIKMDSYLFSKSNLFFYSNDDRNYPDEIDITVVYENYKEESKATIINGIYIFIDNYIGELNSITVIDNLRITGRDDPERELIPIDKLKSFLIWRQKEFVEKYEGVLQETNEGNYSVMEGELENGNMLLATINTDILNWENKASHPWIVTVEIKFDGSKTNGMPSDSTFEMLNDFEEGIVKELKDFDGYLNIGRQTAEGLREIYFACKDFRLPSKVLERKIRENPKMTVGFEIAKDKYWQSLERFNQTVE